MKIVGFQWLKTINWNRP